MNGFDAAVTAASNAERRRAPRIGPIPKDAGRLPAYTPTIQELRGAPRRTGEASIFFFDQRFQFNAVKVLPGEYFVSDENMVIQTVLGSCIAACLWDSRTHVGGMNHFMLPEGDGADQSGRYGSYAMEVLINEMMKLARAARPCRPRFSAADRSWPIFPRSTWVSAIPSSCKATSPPNAFR